MTELQKFKCSFTKRDHKKGGGDVPCDKEFGTEQQLKDHVFANHWRQALNQSGLGKVS